MIRKWFFRKQCMQDEGLYVAIQYIIYQKQISRNKGAKKKATTKKKKKTKTRTPQKHQKKKKKKNQKQGHLKSFIKR